jgi:hypothetical protein
MNKMAHGGLIRWCRLPAHSWRCSKHLFVVRVIIFASRTPAY